MDSPEDGPWQAPVAPVAAEYALARPQTGDRPPARSRGFWRGARTGFRLSSIVMGPLVGVFGLAALVPTAIGLGSGRGFGVHQGVFGAAGVYLVFAGFGVVIGGAIGLILGLFPARAGGLSVVDRPIRLRFWKKPAADRPARRSQWPWVLGGLAGLVLVVGFGVGVYLGRLVDRRLAAAIAAADLDDPNWRVDDLMAHRDLVPDLENSAIVVGAVVSGLPEDWPLPPASGLPSPEESGLNQAYQRATEGPGNLALEAATSEILRRELNGFEEEIRLARTLVNYSRGRHELVLGPTLIDTPLRETQRARTAARLLAVDAALRADAGDLDGGLDSCRALIGVARSIGDEPFLISQLVHSGIGNLGLKSTIRVLGQGEPSDVALARIQALLLEEMNAPLLLLALCGERATLTEVIRRMGTGELRATDLSGQDVMTSDGSARGEIAPWGRLWFDNQRAVALEWMNEAVAIARRPAIEQPPGWRAWNAENERVRQSRIELFTSMAPLLLVSSLSVSYSAQTRYQAELGATALLLAAERHRHKAGEWPASAEVISPEILASPPLDPFSGRPFLFDRRDGRLIVHSVGPNLRDERGAYEPKRWNSGGPDDVNAIAWDVPLRRQTSPSSGPISK